MVLSQEVGPEVVGGRAHGGGGGASPRGSGGARGRSGGEQAVEGVSPARKEEEAVAWGAHASMTSHLLVTTYMGQCPRRHIPRVVEGRYRAGGHAGRYLEK